MLFAVYHGFVGICLLPVCDYMQLNICGTFADIVVSSGVKNKVHLHAVLKLLDEAVDAVGGRTRGFGVHRGKTLANEGRVFTSRAAPDRKLAVPLTVSVIGSNTVTQT